MNALRLVILGLTLTACQDQPAQSTGPTPPPVAQGVAAFISVDNLNARVGQTVRLRVEVQVGTEHSYKVGSYTGRLRFNPARLEFRTENAVNDGLRIANATGAATGEIRFAGAAATGFNSLVLYDGTFVVKNADYAADLALQMEELSAAVSLTNLAPQLRVNRQIFLSRTAGH
ncbi:MAG: hypothetical protein AAB409_03705 [Gemmatimonadota bacterium]